MYYNSYQQSNCNLPGLFSLAQQREIYYYLKLHRCSLCTHNKAQTSRVSFEKNSLVLHSTPLGAQAGRQQLVVGAKASGRDARDAAKRELAIVFKDWRSALAYSVGGELFKQTDGRETRRVQSANKPNALVESTNIHIYMCM